MALSQKIQQKQTGSLTLTPQLRQAIKLLELSNLELESYLAQEILDNPLLELAGPEGDTPSGQEDAGDAESAEDLETPLAKSGDEDWEQSVDPGAGAQEAYDNLWTNQSEADRWEGASSRGGSAAMIRPENGDGEDYAAALGVTRLTLQDHLMGQLYADFSDPMDLMIGTRLIEGLDDSGYLTTPLEEIAEGLGCPEDRVSETLSSLQECDPAGVFARDLVECLHLQLQDRDLLTPDMDKILDHLSLYAAGKIDALSKATALNRGDLATALQVLQSLNPKPGLQFDYPVEETFQPDVFVRWQEQDQAWRIHLNEATLPKVLIDTGYYAQVTAAGKKEVNAYLKERYKSGNWLVKALDQRAQTILKVASEIVQQQEDFLKKGLRYLKPMTLKDIARAVDLHESTISRVTQNKYMLTPRGTFDMKIFFSSSVASMAEDTLYSSSSVQDILQSMIHAEPPEAPLSDDQLVQALAEKGIDVARRTISKYRGILRIPSSYERRRAHLRQL